jgi:hypothetical protein
MTEPQELLDVLWDALDEYEAFNCDLPTLVTDLASIVAELDTHHAESDWIADLQREVAVLAALRDQHRASGAWELTATQRAAADDSARRVRALISVRPAPSPSVRG